MSEIEQRKVIPNVERAQLWLEQAKWAPSGGNAQPWLVEYEENFNQVAFRLSIDPAYKPKASLMDVSGIASALSIGSLVENLILTAEKDSYNLVCHKIEAVEDVWSGAVQLLFEKKSRSISLALASHVNPEAVLERHTHRGIYNSKKLSDNFLHRLAEILDDFKTLNYKIFEPENKSLYRGLSILEKIRWQHQPYLQGLLSEISFGKKDKEQTVKIPSTQLGIAFFDRIFLRSLKKFPALGTFLMKLGLAHIPVMKSTRRFVNNCQKVVFIQAPETNFASSYKLGRCFQRLWIHCSASGVAFQPNGNGLIALGHWLTPKNINLPSAYRTRVQEATEIFKNQFDLDLKKPIVGFRIGYSDERMDRSPRKNIQSIQRHDLIRKIQRELL